MRRPRANRRTAPTAQTPRKPQPTDREAKKQAREDLAAAQTQLALYGQAVTQGEFVLNAIAADQKKLAADQEWGWATTPKMMKPLEKALEELMGRCRSARLAGEGLACAGHKPREV